MGGTFALVSMASGHEGWLQARRQTRRPSADRDPGMRISAFAPACLVSLATLGCPGRPADSKATATPSVAKERPPVILITIDTLRPDHMSVYGYARDTTPRLA